MAIDEHLETFGGKKVVFVSFEEPGAFSSAATEAPHLAIGWDDDGEDDRSIQALFGRLLGHAEAEQIDALLIGQWAVEMYDEDSSGLVEMLSAAAEQLPNLKRLFIGEMTYEENEISWIQHSDVTALFEAFPLLDTFAIRGSNGLKLGPVQHSNLEVLKVETGGLPKSILTEIAASELPSLKQLDLCFGRDEYGWDGNIDDVMTFVDTVVEKFPHVTHLGLRNMDGDMTDQVAQRIADHKVLDQLHYLDLSLGTLTDEGAEALLASEKVAKLKALNLRHNFMTDPVRERFIASPVDVDVDPDGADSWEDDGVVYRYCAIGE